MINTDVSRSGIRRLSYTLHIRFFSSLGIHIVVVFLLIVGMFVSRDFLTSENLLNIIRPVTLLGIVAVGLMFVTYGGHYVDLSIPAIMALSGMVKSEASLK